MVQTPNKLPKFKNPPVAEVILGVQYAPLSAMHVGHIGILWEQFKSKFSRVEQQPRLPHVIERKGNPAPPALLPSISLMSPSDLIPRVWMLNEDGTELIQVQTDRFLRNWRRYHKNSLPYPSYDNSGRPGFAEDFKVFCNFVRDQGLGDVEIDQCEMSYINHIRPCGVWSDVSELDKVFRGWAASYPSLSGSRANSIGCRVRHEVADERGDYVGHLFGEVDSGYLTTETGELMPVFQLQLILRGRPFGKGMDGVLAFMDFAHATIVQSFAEATTPEMHKVWERIQ